MKKLGLLQKADAACCGITVAQCHTLVEIGRTNGLSLNELSEALTLDKSTMSRTVDNLVKTGLVERQSDNEDRRYTKITLTAEGTEMVKAINSGMEEYFERVLRSIPKEKCEAVIEILPYLLTAVKNTEMGFAVRQVCSGTTQDKGGANCE
ncbi:MarR family winged helix-turn-helix transcriptional regulator [Sporomusa acidovorans]|uniref:MarR family winged helix-turn-helix transcriptional regulator n=1 Tax=Sporomusa acidovorans TaxID=112900 RepID=UPI001FDEE7CC|nr:MarR family transcriptional regulator [Sporomusa acidovorans]